ncbi:hypothetical protein G7076_11965 [Sphingomonas sp. HDW15A]|uniref:hypothetical protein n=1 Tax=Sphingomonas sp. HDW15A TaxID=2714942 RepID=UPI00140967E2|nr:hypothetical protein [Sphingomonas sp. HDW15A]QIK97040.1 hypothetical protein G7076_11965 [Sphingomonas sp. HDW15A]
MLHLFFDNKPWFRAKRYGIGAGCPITWQGWAILGLHIALILGIVAALRDRPLGLLISLLIATIAPLPIYAARTEGGWKWRWGK